MVTHPKIPIPIIILNWNGLNDTIECIRSLLAMNPFPIEIILVDNGSRRDVKKEVSRLYQDHPDVTLIVNETNKGFTRGNYDIVEEILNRNEVPEYIALLNNDTAVTPNWIESLVTSARENSADVISSKMVNYYDRRKIDNLGHFMLNTGEILPLGHRQSKELFNDVFENLGACGGAALYRTSMIREIGFFDLYFDTGYEDAEYGLRAKILGFKCVFEPTAIVYHKVSRSINKIRNDQYLQHIQMNIFYTYIKLMPKSFLISNVIFVFLKYVIWFLFGLFTFQFKLLKLHTETLYLYFKEDFRKALKNRKEFYSAYGDRINSRTGSLKVKFFFLTDIRRLMFHVFPR